MPPGPTLIPWVDESDDAAAPSDPHDIDVLKMDPNHARATITFLEPITPSIEDNDSYGRRARAALPPQSTLALGNGTAFL